MNRPNAIATRIQDFLHRHPPFNLLEAAVLHELAAQVVVRYMEQGQVVFDQNEATGPYFYIIREGAVHLLDQEEGDHILVDELEEGDIFGVRPLLADQSYAFRAVIKEEALLYAIPIEAFAPILRRVPEVAWYMARNMASQVGRTVSNLHRGRLFLENDRLIDRHFRLVEIQSLETSKTPVTCPPDTTIRQAALVMTAHRVSSIIVVDEDRNPVGIVTDKDLRTKVVTGHFPTSAAIRDIMASPVSTIAPNKTVADVQIEMVRSRVHHLCVTQDGTDRSPVLGVLSEHDLLVVQGNNPAILVREALRSNTLAELLQLRERSEKLLEKYIYQEVSIAYITHVMSEVNDVLIQRIIGLCRAQLAQEGQPVPDVPFAWLSMGSAGRQEQLLRTDQDSALVFADVAPAERETVRRQFVRLAERVTQWLRELGFDYCPGKMMASNPQWCKTLPEWKRQFSDWITHPDPQHLRYCTIFIDYRPVFGDERLTEQLTDHIFRAIDLNPGFLSFLARMALENPPPLSFFRNFMVERSGEYKDNFDIKKRAMLPLADAARVLILESKVGKINNTFNRFEKLADIEPAHRELFETAAEAYEVLIRYRTLQGLRNRNSGRYFKIAELSKMERLNLRNSFQPIRKLQGLLSVRFQLSYLR